jgi:hypothetical protein
MTLRLFIERPLELEFHLFESGAALMFDVSDGCGWYGDSSPATEFETCDPARCSQQAAAVFLTNCFTG